MPNGEKTNVTDVFNVTANAWSTAVLSVARTLLAATSLPNQGIAIFAGGEGTSTCLRHCLSFCVVCCVVKGALELKEYVVLTAWPCLIP
jgi:hypothetical protein